MRGRDACVGVLALLCALPLARPLQAEPPEGETTSGLSVVQRIHKAATEGRLLYQLTTPQESTQLLGKPHSEDTQRDGGMEVMRVTYPNVMMIFARMREQGSPFTLRFIQAGGKKIDIGENRLVELRDNNDLSKFDRFWGFANASLAKLDLRKEEPLLRQMPFDSRTQWPTKKKLPGSFNPTRILEEGKNPGLGVRALHQRGIDGRGVHVAIIDQPLLVDHEDYRDQIEAYRTIDVAGMEPQMHGPAVASLLVGTTCGVAPKARLTYYAVPSWKNDNKHYAQAINEIIDQNEKRSPKERIRVVSISTGLFAQQKHADAWESAMKRARRHGLLVITCDPSSFQYGTLDRKPDASPDKPEDYVKGKYTMSPDALRVPAGHRTTAGHQGQDVYTYRTEGGMSWAAPYLAGLAALAYQENPKLSPEKIQSLLQETAAKTKAGRIVNPTAFIERAHSADRLR